MSSTWATRTLRVGRVLSDEPDRGGSFFDFGPRLLMRMDDVPRTEVVKPGSRISYRLLVAGADDALAQLHTELDAKLGATYRWMGIRESTPSIGSALDRAQAFLLLGGLLAVLLAGVAVALAAHRYARRHYDHVAILKTLGATPSEIQWGYLALLGAVGGVAAIAGLAARRRAASSDRRGTVRLHAAAVAAAPASNRFCSARSAASSVSLRLRCRR